MRDPKRIPEFLAVVQECWEKVPDWRFGQLFENLTGYCGTNDLFYVEDDKVLQNLKSFFKLDEKND